MSVAYHEPVLVAEVLEALRPASSGIYVDVTLGGGGHTDAILQASAPDGMVIALDRDAQALQAAGERLTGFGKRLRLVHAPFDQVGEVLRVHEVPGADGLVADLGVSSAQLDHPERGFSFRGEGPLDMRMDQEAGGTALEWIAGHDEDELADVIYEYGGERRSRPIARSIKRAQQEGRLLTTADLRSAVVRVLGPKRGRIDPATRTFQALRIVVNDELGQLERLLALLPTLLRDGGVAAIISFQSLEDRLVKWAFRNNERLEPITKRPIVPSPEECERNPRARSAKLRVARLVPEAA